MKTFKTPKGTELPFLNLKGKDYLQVMHRLVWFREDHSDWSIETEFVHLNDLYAISKATIRNEKGALIAQAHGREDKGHFQDFIEKCETKAIGRALGLCGYGTQFAPEFDEHDRIVDSPAPPKPKPLYTKIDMAKMVAKPSQDKIETLLTHLQGVGVSKDMVETYIRKKAPQMDNENYVKLADMGRAIKEGADVEDVGFKMEVYGEKK